MKLPNPFSRITYFKMSNLSFIGKLKRFLLVCLIIIPYSVFAQSTDPSSRIDHFLKIAAQNNPELRATYDEYRASLKQIPQAGALPDPEVAFGYFISPVETRVGPQQARLSINQMFPWFGTLGAQKNVKENEAWARFRQFQNTRNRLFYEVKSTWYELYVLDQRISILEENIHILETLEKLVLQKFETAQSSQSDVLQVQIELEDLRINYSNLLDNRRVLWQTFLEQLNTDDIDQPEQMKLSPLPLPADGQNLQEKMLANNPSLEQLSARKVAAEEFIREAHLNSLPKIGIGADYIFHGESATAMTNSGKDAFMGRISIQLPIFRKKYRAQKEQAKLRRSSVMEQQTARQNKLITELQQSLRDYQNANRKLNLYEETQIDRTQQAIDVMMEEYTSADADFEEILRLQRRLLDYQQAREEAIAKQNRAVAYIEFLTGHYNIEPNNEHQ